VEEYVICSTKEILHQLLLLLMGRRSSNPRVLSKLDRLEPTLLVHCGQGHNIIPSLNEVLITLSKTVSTLAKLFMNSHFNVRSEMYW
jgi:hypothetical protein